MKSDIRIIVKGIVWELIGLLLIYILTKDLKVSGIYVGLRILLYYFYHKIWKYIKWRK